MTHTRPVAVCALCGQELVSGSILCAHHAAACDERWAAVNRIMCDFLHRGIVPTRLDAAERAADQVPMYMADAA